ncbi:MAG: hypothetical protein JJT85_08915 [Chromatiales bacterium]|nr:hypothetical protein [Chromatiales bacterium]
MSTEAEIRAFFDQYEECWSSRNYSGLGELWDRDDPQPFYRPMEVDGYIDSWTGLERYWEPRPGVSYVEAPCFCYKNLKLKLVAPDVAIAMSDFSWDLKLRGGGITPVR